VRTKVEISYNGLLHCIIIVLGNLCFNKLALISWLQAAYGAVLMLSTKAITVVVRFCSFWNKRSVDFCDFSISFCTKLIVLAYYVSGNKKDGSVGISHEASKFKGCGAMPREPPDCYETPHSST